MEVILGISALVLALGASIASLVRSYRTGSSEGEANEAEAADKITAAAIRLLVPLEQRITDLEKAEEFLQASLYEKDKEISALKNQRDYRISELEKMLLDARGRIRKLEEICKSMGLDPIKVDNL